MKHSARGDTGFELPPRRIPDGERPRTLVRAVFLQRHHPGTKQLDTGAAIHGSLEGFQLVNLSFGLPVAPRFRHGVADSLNVLTYGPRKALHRVDARCAGVGQPIVQALRRSSKKQASHEQGAVKWVVSG